MSTLRRREKLIVFDFDQHIQNSLIRCRLLEHRNGAGAFLTKSVTDSDIGQTSHTLIIKIVNFTHLNSPCGEKYAGSLTPGVSGVKSNDRHLAGSRIY